MPILCALDGLWQSADSEKHRANPSDSFHLFLASVKRQRIIRQKERQIIFDNFDDCQAFKACDDFRHCYLPSNRVNQPMASLAHVPHTQRPDATFVGFHQYAS